MASDRVDREARVIRGYSVMSLGEAKGHGMVVDEHTLEQLVQLGNASPSGIKTRVRHPDSTHDGFGRFVGKSRAFRREGDKVVADLHVSEVAFRSPEGDLGTYVLELAASDDDTFGASPEVRHIKQRLPNSQLPAMRLKELKAIAIVDDPATNLGFFSCLSVGDDDMADNAELESKMAELSAKNADLSAERDLLTEEVGNLKARVSTLETEAKATADGKVAELSAVRSEVAGKVVTEERNRVCDILALCSKAGKADLSAKFVTDGVAVADVQKQLFEVLCTSNKPIGDGSTADLSAKPDENAKYKTEFAAAKTAYLSAGVTEEDYITSRRIDDGLETLAPKLNAA